MRIDEFEFRDNNGNEIEPTKNQLVIYIKSLHIQIKDLQHRLDVAEKALELAVNNISWCPAKQGECNCKEHNEDCSWFLKRKAEKELKGE